MSNEIKTRHGLAIKMNGEYILKTGERVTVINVNEDFNDSQKLTVKLASGELESRFLCDFWRDV
jgi:NhaP-type Na+/H+ and K+/H+ antiporter